MLVLEQCFPCPRLQLEQYFSSLRLQLEQYFYSQAAIGTVFLLPKAAIGSHTCMLEVNSHEMQCITCLSRVHSLTGAVTMNSTTSTTTH
jgi:hypothetical protein